MLIDTHCHFNHKELGADMPDTIRRAGDASVERMVVVGFDLPSSLWAVELADAHECLFAAVGIHPHDARHWTDEAAESLIALSDNSRVCAIGEIGLDYYRDLSPREAQAQAFRAQMRIACRLKLPVIIHCRDAYDDTLQILEEEGISKIGGVMHCWAGSVAQATKSVELGLHLGFGGTLTYKTADNVRDSLKTVPIDSVLVETDAPYLSPVPLRGKRNEPAHVRIIADYAAQLLGMESQKFDDITTANALRCFPRLADALPSV